LAKQLALDLARWEIAGPRARARSKGGRNSGGLAGEPTLWDLTQKSMRTRIASDEATGTDMLSSISGTNAP
jgi:hypothetical protein